jgi:hypothetical protein
MTGHVMYKVRFTAEGKKPRYVRYSTEAEAREVATSVRGAKYIGPVTVAASSRHGWKEVR